MPLSRPLVVLAGAALAGIALVGVGASASFTDSTSSAQKITAGQMNVVVSASNVPGCTTAANGCKSLSLPDVGPVGSSFESPATHVVVTNNGNVAAYFDAMQMSESDNGSSASVTLRNEVNICIRSTDNSGTWVEGNGPLTTAVALHPTVKQNPVKLDPGQSASYWFSIYAGQDSECGTITSYGSEHQGGVGWLRRRAVPHAGQPHGRGTGRLDHPEADVLLHWLISHGRGGGIVAIPPPQRASGNAERKPQQRSSCQPNVRGTQWWRDTFCASGLRAVGYAARCSRC